MIVLSHPTGNQNSRQAAMACAEVGWLSCFATALHVEPNNPIVRALPRSIRRELSRRDFSEIGGPIESLSPWRELIRLIASRLGYRPLVRHETGWASVDQVYQSVDRRLARDLQARSGTSAVYAYEDGALDSFRVAKGRGIVRLYELPIGYWQAHRRYNEDELLRNPRWADTWHAIRDSAEKLARKDEEIALADVIIVASRFTADTLRSYPQPLPPVRLVPYACPPAIRPSSRRWYRSGRLRLLFVGSLSQRKGLAEIVQAVSALGTAIELSVVGVGPAATMLRQRLPQANFLGSISHSEVLEQMRRHDVLLFPSLFEGFGMVITEALSQGMVVIASDRTGLADIADESCSRAVAAGDSEGLQAAIAGLLERPASVSALGHAALECAQGNQWPDYRRRLRQVIEEFWKP